MVAAHLGDLDAMRRLIAGGANPAARDAQGFTAMHAAAAGSTGDAMRFLCSLGDARVEVDSRNSTNATPLHVACLRGNVEAARILLAQGADREAREDAEGQTPLFMALKGAQTELLVALLDDALTEGKRFDVNAVQEDGTPLLIYAVTRPRALFDTVLALLAAGADKEARHPKTGETALAIADRRGLLAIASLLLSKYAYVR